jgi:hypothetical protein
MLQNLFPQGKASQLMKNLSQSYFIQLFRGKTHVFMVRITLPDSIHSIDSKHACNAICFKNQIIISANMTHTSATVGTK